MPKRSHYLVWLTPRQLGEVRLALSKHIEEIDLMGATAAESACDRRSALAAYDEVEKAMRRSVS